MSRFDYPVLPRKEIIGVLSDSQIATLTDADLLNPNSDFVINLYTQLLIHINCLQGDDCSLVEFDDLVHLENPDLHTDAIRIMTLFHKIKAIVSALQCPKTFNLKDLVRPQPDRTQFFLGSILNFCLHRDAQMNRIKPKVDKLMSLEDQRKEMEDRIFQLNAEIADYNELREKDMPLVQETESKIIKLQQSIAALNNHQMSLKATYNKKKDALQEINQKISSANFDLLQTVQENHSLSTQIVSSPDKLLRALEEKKSVQVEAQNAEKAAQKTLNEKEYILEVYTKASEKMIKHSKKMQTLQEQVNSAKQVEKEVKVLNAKISNDGVLDKSLEANLYIQQNRVDQLEEILKQLQKERDLKREEASKELNNVRSQVEYNRRGLEQRQVNIEALVAEEASIRERINMVKYSAEAEQQILLHKCEEIANEFFKYSNSTGQLFSRIEATGRCDSQEKTLTET